MYVSSKNLNQDEIVTMDSSNSDICILNSVQVFLISTTIHQVRNLPSCNMETYVVLSMDDQKKKTPKHAPNQNPFFNQYFSFESNCRLDELRQKCLKISVMEVKNCCKDEIIGEVFVDLNTVWSLNKEHALFKKWVPLKASADNKMTDHCPCGNLQLDMIIISQHDPPVPSTYHQNECEDIDENMLSMPFTQQGGKVVKYIVSIYKGQFMDKGDYYVEIGLGGHVSRTRKISRHSYRCEWNEQIMFQTYYPSLSQSFLIQVMRKEFLCWKTYAHKHIFFDEITFESDDYPSIGPTYLHLYDTYNPLKYLGCILLSINVEDLIEFVPKLPSVISITPFFETEFWKIEDFYINILIINAPLIYGEFNKIQLKFQCGEVSSNQVDLSLLPFKVGRWYSKESKTFNCLCAKIQLPDVRMKYQIDFYMNAVIRAMQCHLKNVRRFAQQVEGNEDGLERQAYFWKAICILLKGELSHLMEILYLDLFKKVVQWDRNRIAFLRQIVSNKIEQLNEMHVTDDNHLLEFIEKNVKDFLDEFQSIIAKRLQDKWPDIFVTARYAGPQPKSTSYGVLKLKANKLCLSDSARYMGPQCGKNQTLLLKTSSCNHVCKKCDCIFGLLKLCAWIVTNQQEISGWSPIDYRKHDALLWESTRDTFYHCNIYVHQAKISRPEHELEEISDIDVLATFGNEMKSTKTLRETVSPVWNEIIAFNCVSMPGYATTSLLEYPPLYILEVRNRRMDEYLMGTVFLKPSVHLLRNNSILESSTKSKTNENALEYCEEDDIELNSSVEDVGRKMFAPNLKYLAKNIQDLYKLNSIFPPPLSWERIIRNGEVCGEILISAELIQLHSKKEIAAALEGNILQIPQEISLIMKTFKLEFAFIGLRNAFLHPARTIGRFRIEMNFGNVRLKSGPSTMRCGRSFNFLNPYATAFISIPATRSYWPSLELKLMDCVQLTKETSVGVTMIPNPGVFYQESPPQMQKFQYSFKICHDTVSINITNQNRPNLNEKYSKIISLKRTIGKNLIQYLCREKVNTKIHTKQDQYFTWWAKFYNSLEANRYNRKHTLTIFETELENLPQFEHLKDWASSIPMLSSPNARFEKHIKMKPKLGDLRCAISIYEPAKNLPLSSIIFKQMLRLTEETKVSVYVYVVRGLAFRTRPITGQFKSFVTVEYGGLFVKEFAHNAESQSNPIFGLRIQLSGMIPRDVLMKIAIYDCDRDVEELVGATVVDIEDRLRTKYGAACGLQNEFSRQGYNAWHHIDRPSTILRNLCILHNIPEPVYVGNKIQVDNVTFDDLSLIECGECLGERLSLSVLKQLSKVPSIGYNLIPEHVETRSLFRFDRPGVEQGKLQMWINVFESNKIPANVDIIPHGSRDYELRVIISQAFIDMNVNLSTQIGTKPINVYVKGKFIGNVQCTDVHYAYNHLSGAAFNWRMLFPCCYNPAEDMIILPSKKTGCPLRRINPLFTIELWIHNEPVDLCLGSCTLNLSHLTTIFDNASQSFNQCSVDVCNLFLQKSFTGAFQIFRQLLPNEAKTLVGKIEIELNIVTSEIATSKPVGRGRDGPSPLAYPRDHGRFWKPIHLLKSAFISIKQCLINTSARERWILGAIILIKIFLIIFIIIGMRWAETFKKGRQCLTELNDFGIEETKCNL